MAKQTRLPRGLRRTTGVLGVLSVLMAGATVIDRDRSGGVGISALPGATGQPAPTGPTGGGSGGGGMSGPPFPAQPPEMSSGPPNAYNSGAYPAPDQSNGISIYNSGAPQSLSGQGGYNQAPNYSPQQQLQPANGTQPPNYDAPLQTAPAQPSVAQQAPVSQAPAQQPQPTQPQQQAPSQAPAQSQQSPDRPDNEPKHPSPECQNNPTPKCPIPDPLHTVWDYIKKSPTMTDIFWGKYVNGPVDIVWGPGQGTSFDPKAGTVTIGEVYKNSASDATGALAHELGHTQYEELYPKPADYKMSVPSCLNWNLQNEGYASFIATKVRREILDAGGSSTLVPGFSGAAADAIYQGYLDAGSTSEALTSAVSQFAVQFGNLKTSTTGQNYVQYYTAACQG